MSNRESLQMKFLNDLRNDRSLDTKPEVLALWELEAQRLKERCSHVPFFAKRAAQQGESYWLTLAKTYRPQKH